MNCGCRLDSIPPRVIHTWLHASDGIAPGSPSRSALQQIGRARARAGGMGVDHRGAHVPE